MISSACSFDCFATGFAYGVNKIKISLLATTVICTVCGIFFAAALFAGTALGNYISPTATLIISVTVLLILGTLKLAGGIIKNVIRKKNGINKDIKFSFLSLKFILNISANPEDADSDLSKILSAREAIPLSIALSIDSLPAGLGAGLLLSGAAAYVILIGFSLITNIIFLLSGRLLGTKIAKKTRIDLSWVAGLIFVLLAVLQFFI